jgi:NAD(P)-dependent dehydrogenase (short-subunit alcohol dehydrogenase family)
MGEGIQNTGNRSRGIGLATAKRFLADGWHVALLDIDDETLDRTHAALPSSDTIIAIHCDVSKPETVLCPRMRT